MITTIVSAWTDELGEAVLQQLLQVLDVARHPGHDHAGLLLGVEVEAEPLQVGEDAHPQVVHDARGQPAGDPHLRALRDRGDRDRQQEDQADADDHRDALVTGEHPVVDPVLISSGPGLVGDADDRDEHERERAELPVTEDQRPQGEVPAAVVVGAGR